MNFGVWYDCRNPPQWERPYSEIYGDTVEQATWADQNGFSSIWFSEHHGVEDGYLPALFPMLGAIAMQTTAARLGTAILLAPLHHPIRFAEDAAVVDILTQGRLELGLAPGYRVEEFRTFGVSKRERGGRTSELIEIARKAWSGERFDHKGKYWSFRDALVMPPPVQAGGPQIWIGGASIHAAKRAGRLGCCFMPDSIAPLEVYDTYRTTLVEHGYDPTQFPIATNRTFYLCEDPEQGWEEVKAHFLYAHNLYRTWFAAAGDHSFSGPPLEDADQLPRDVYVVGTPQQVIAEIESMKQRFAFDHLFFWARPPGLPIERSYRSLELFARQVIPHFSDEPRSGKPPG